MAFLIAIGVAGALGATSGPLHRRGGAPLIYLTGAIAAAVLAAASLVLRVEPAEISRGAVVAIAGLPIAAGAVAAALAARDGESPLRSTAFSMMAGFVGAAGAFLISLYAGWVFV